MNKVTIIVNYVLKYSSSKYIGECIVMTKCCSLMNSSASISAVSTFK